MSDKPLRILIVDDSPEDRESYRRRIARDSSVAYEFLETSLGEEGLVLARRERPDCILLDYNLPDLDGLVFLDRLRAEDNEMLIPVIMLTGQGNETVAVESLKRGAQDYLVKQLNGNDLQHAVSRVIERVFLQVQRKHAEEELRRSQEEFRAMANSIPQLAWMARPDGWIFWYNQRWHDYCGSTPEQVEGWGWKSVHDPNELPQDYRKMERGHREFFTVGRHIPTSPARWRDAMASVARHAVSRRDGEGDPLVRDQHRYHGGTQQGRRARAAAGTASGARGPSPSGPDA